VLNIQRAADGKMDRTTPITVFHLSFRDFLVDPELTKESIFSISAEKTNRTLGMHCIRLLQSGGLREDICAVTVRGTRRSEAAKCVVYASLPEAVVYACCHWVEHIMNSGEKVHDNDVVHQFLQNHLLP
jgi:hypothetical protein